MNEEVDYMKKEALMFIHHICIQTEDYQKSKSFYMEVLGFSLLQETPDFHGRDFNTWLSLNGFMIELQTAKAGKKFEPYHKEREGIPHFCLYSEAFDEDYRKIKGLAGLVFRQKNGADIYEVEKGRLFKVIAPEGTIIEIRDQLSL